MSGCRGRTLPKIGLTSHNRARERWRAVLESEFRATTSRCSQSRLFRSRTCSQESSAKRKRLAEIVASKTEAIRWTLDSTLDSRLWTPDFGLPTLDSGLWTLDSGLWTPDSGQYAHDSRSPKVSQDGRRAGSHSLPSAGTARLLPEPRTSSSSALARSEDGLRITSASWERRSGWSMRMVLETHARRPETKRVVSGRLMATEASGPNCG